MDDSLHVTLVRWANFYMITGGAAAALTGLQFIVQTLLSSELLSPVGGRDPEGTISAFGTPTIVHFTLALVLSTMLCVPWPSYNVMRASLGVVGVVAFMYSGLVWRRATAQNAYKPETEDWIFHIMLPAVAYGAVLLAAFFLDRDNMTPLFAIAAAVLLLLCVGIHNAWDTVTYLTIRAIQRMHPEQIAPQPPRSKDQKKKHPPRGRNR